MLATRTAGSHGIDVWAVNENGRLTLFEVKSTKRNVYYPHRTNKDINQMLQFVETLSGFGGTVAGYYAIKYGAEWRFFGLEALNGCPLRKDGGHDVPY